MASAPAGSKANTPLGAADLKLLNQALYKLSDAVHVLDKMETAGMDVSGQRMMQQDLLTQLTAFKQTFFPGAQ